MDHGYVLLLEREEMWAKMLIEVLEDNNIPCAAVPVLGAGFALKTGAHECLRVYVPNDHLPQATVLVEELFSAENVEEEE